VRRRLAVATLIILWCALLAAMLGRHAWPLDLFSHFRVQYALLFLIVAIVLFALRSPLLGALSAVGAVFAAIPIVSYMGVQTARAETGSPGFRVVQFNTWFRNRDYAEIGSFLEKMQPDVIVLEERTRQEAQRLGEFLPSYPYSYNEPRPHGVVIFARWPIASAESLPLAEGGVLAARVTLDWRGRPITVLGAHLHWPLGSTNSRLRNAELAGLATLAAARTEPLIVAGDFNITPWSAHFRAALERSGLTDSAAGHGLAPSWPAQFPPLGIRIDHCWVSRHWRSTDVRLGPSLGSDHLPLIADLEFTP
jgi:endonuclease/exonuclease/phosphatase (EEP) superfamily protein YafD